MEFRLLVVVDLIEEFERDCVRVVVASHNGSQLKGREGLEGDVRDLVFQVVVLLVQSCVSQLEAADEDVVLVEVVGCDFLELNFNLLDADVVTLGLLEEVGLQKEMRRLQLSEMVNGWVLLEEILYDLVVG